MNSSSRRQFGLVGIGAAFVLGVVVATAGSWIGWSLWSSTAENTESLSSEPAVQIEHTESSELGVAESTSSAQAGTQKATLEEISKIPTDFSRRLALSRMALESDEDRLLDLIDQAEKFHVEFHSEAKRAFVGRLYEIDPEFTLSIVENFHPSLVQSIFRQRAKTDLADAVARAKPLEGEIREQAIMGILTYRPDISPDQLSEINRELDSEHLSAALVKGRELSEIERDPQKAWYEALQHDSYDRDQIGTLVSTALKWIKQDGLDTVDKITASLEDTHVQEDVLKSVLLSAMLFTEPKDVFARALELDVDSNERILSLVAASWAELDPQSAFDAVNDVDNTNLVRNQLLPTVIHNWALTDPRTVLDEIERFPKDLQVYARKDALETIARSNPREAISLTESLNLGSAKSSLMSEIASIWAQEDSEAALAWVLSKQESESGRSQLLSAVVGGWSQRDPIAALDWVLDQRELSSLRNLTLPTILKNLADEDPELALQRALEQPISPNRIGLEHTVISHIALYDAQLAKSMLQQTREGETRVSSYTAVGLAMISRSNTNEALELANDLLDSDRTKYVKAMLAQWAVNDSHGLLDELSQMSDPQMQSRAAASLIAGNEWRKNLTEDQVKYVRKYLTGVEAGIIPETR